MGKEYDCITDSLATWISQQHLFFVATAPRDGERVNVSPKGLDGTFAILGPHRVGYLDYSGSGAETIAHVGEPGNGRITFMFCAFEGRPMILRLYGQARAVMATDPEFAELRTHFPRARTAGQRSIIVADIDLIKDSCGWSVPTMDFVAERDVLDLHQEKKGDAYYMKRFTEESHYSLDGLPAYVNDAPRPS